MFNLLPQEDQRTVLLEYRFRLAIIGMFFSAVLWMIASVALAPSLFLSHQVEMADRAVVGTLEKEISLIASDELSQSLSSSNKKITALSVDAPAAYFHELVSTIISDKIKGIKILGIDIRKADTGSKDVTIAGEANKRDALLSFIKILENEKGFTGVTVPVSDFAPVTNINFSVILKTK